MANIIKAAFLRMANQNLSDFVTQSGPGGLLQSHLTAFMLSL